MKFLCDNCKAKYQIADEKVAGKTVRMKCRKCGHQIEVRAAVTETSVASKPPEAPRPAQKSSLATSLSAQKPRAPQAQPASQGSGALAGAFQRSVQDAPPPSSSQPSPGQQPVEISVTNEWYVAINGVPVGPVRISELRRKAASGVVTEDSLCWQEGLEEWRPIRSIPDLAALVREAAQGNRPSLVAPPPAAPAPAPPRAAPAPPAAARSAPPPKTEPVRPAPAAPAPAQRSNVVPLHPDRGPQTSPLGGAAAALAPTFTPAPAPAASAYPQPTPAPSPVQPSLAPQAVSDPFAVPAPNPFAISSPMAAPSLLPAAPSYLPAEPARRGVPLWFWPVLVLALGFGGGLAFVLFRQPPQPPPVVIQMPPTSTPAATDNANVPPPHTDPAPPASGTTAAAPTGKSGAVAMNPRPGGPAPAPTEKRTADLSGLLGSSGGGTGPATGPGGGPGGSSAQGLDSAAVERVVASHRAGVKRQCWERASEKGSVSVMVSVTVAPDGSVQNASSTGDDPVVAKCIENQVRSWRFPAPGATTTVNIPFKFFRQ